MNSYGVVPPDPETVTLPVAAPKHRTFVARVVAEIVVAAEDDCAENYQKKLKRGNNPFSIGITMIP